MYMMASPVSGQVWTPMTSEARPPGSHVADCVLWVGRLVLWVSLLSPGWVGVTAPGWPPTCPPPCHCGLLKSDFSDSRRRTVDCGHEGLTDPPAPLPPGTQALLLAGNRIRPEGLALELGGAGVTRVPLNLSELSLAANHLYTLDGLGIAWKGLLYLELGDNELNYVANKSFVGGPGLRGLCLARNKIELMHPDAFRDLRSLHALDLSENRLFEVRAAWFADLSALRTLTLRANDIHTLSTGDFRFLTSLTTLDLQANKLQLVEDGAFTGLPPMEQLSMQTNDLKAVPLTALRTIPGISELNLGNNPLDRLETGSFSRLNVSVIRLNNMERMFVVEKHAFSALSSLHTLEMYNNDRLVYIDREAFLDLPRLASVVVHSNNLSALEAPLFRQLPSLRQIHLYSNPLYCDCAIAWLVQELTQTSDARNVSYPEHAHAQCAGPDRWRGRAVGELSQAGFPGGPCPPRVLPLCVTDHRLVLGDDMRCDCRAVGVPIPQTTWLLPSTFTGQASVGPARGGYAAGSGRPTEGDKGDLQSNPDLRDELDLSSHVQITDDSTLYISYITESNLGSYTCLASNPYGRDQQQIHVHVRNPNAHVIVVHVTTTSITVTWQSAHYLHDYQILYRQDAPPAPARAPTVKNSTYHVIAIKPYMRSYTVSDLAPGEPYEFCIAVHHQQRTMRINCTTVSTRQPDSHPQGMSDARGYVLGGVLTVLGLAVVGGCMAACVLRRYNRRRRHPSEVCGGDNVSQLFLASMDSVSDTTPITFENRAADNVFDEDDIDEIRSTASMSGSSSGR